MTRNSCVRLKGCVQQGTTFKLGLMRTPKKNLTSTNRFLSMVPWAGVIRIAYVVGLPCVFRSQLKTWKRNFVPNTLNNSSTKTNCVL